MPSWSSRKQAPGERIGFSYDTRGNDQAPQYLASEDVFDNRTGQPSTRYIMSGNDVPHAVTFAPGSLQQVQNGFLGSAPDEAHRSEQHVEQEDKFFVQPNSMQAQSDPDWHYTADDDDAWRRSQSLKYSGTQFTEDWSAVNQQTVTNSDLLDSNVSWEDMLTDINGPADTTWMDFDSECTSPHPDVPIPSLVLPGNANTPPWTPYIRDGLEWHQPRHDLSMTVAGCETSTSRSTCIEGTQGSTSVIFSPPGVSSRSSLSQLEGDMAGINLRISPGQQAYADSEIEVLVNKRCWCGAEFSGQYQASNLARHKRIQHGSGNVLLCLEANCDKRFKRQDARLKHVRKHHPGLVPDAVPRPERRRGSRNTRTAPV